MKHTIDSHLRSSVAIHNQFKLDIASMRTRLLLLAVVVSAYLITDGLGCSVTEAGSGQRKPCQFPFTIAGRTFTRCTTEFDPNGKNWCSTNVDSKGNHIAGGK